MAGMPGARARLRTKTAVVVAAGLAALGLTSPAGGAGAAARPAAAATQTQLEGVTCTGASNCWIVGGRGTQTGRHSLTEHWNGSKWSTVPSPNPAGATDTQLSAVSCPSAAECLAVGVYRNAARQHLPFGERWNGSEWSLVKVPHVVASAQNTLTGITCTGAKNCFAVGGAQSGFRPVAERWDGTKWALLVIEGIGGAGPFVRVSCGRITNCWAAGFWSSGSKGGTLTAHWTGSRFEIPRAPTSFSPGDRLAGDSCRRAVCMAVGIRGTMRTLAERWNGSTWAVTATPNPAGAARAELRAVSCPTTSACMAAGDFSTATAELTLAQRWNGTKWSAVHTPSPAGSSESFLLDDTCTAAANCWAVGFHTTTTGTASLIEHWNGTRWSITRI